MEDLLSCLALPKFNLPSHSRFHMIFLKIKATRHTMGSQGWETHHFAQELFPGLTYEEALQDQESLYELLKISSSNRAAAATDNNGSIIQGQVSLSRGESLLSESTDLNIDLDEALARSLQELEDEIDHVSISEPVQSASRNTENAAAGPSVSEHRNEDDIDPDQMTYEELQSLGETIGIESKGLSERDISSLPSFKYKTGLFSKRGKIAECVICYEAYENRQYITTLPCAHQYHSKCIKRWLVQQKICPVCQLEVRNTENASAVPPVIERRNEDDIDLAQMTHEELQSPGETISIEGKGLSKRDISRLPSFKYKTGLFSKRGEIAKCVICYEAYENRQNITTLPCAHQYHSKCIKRWLVQQKICPVCKTEVNLST
ncbi:hypothetical protein Nepgr_031400 [Nepenthes gracilis]|uniref:RING-type domain-containing protein n=1 Tax=Nepenthes gracilis TaxID=150966 RepID=A0AAD3THH0_NEPGR|nr:hypothetical protein Nepgr_031400 [Nepenthes gracilis]